MQHPRQFILMVVLSLFLSGCMLGPDFLSPPAPTNPDYLDIPQLDTTVGTSGPAGEPQYFVMVEHIPAQWWMLFHSEALNDLIHCGFSNSPTIAAAQATLLQAQENVNVQVGQSLYPAVDAQAFTQRQKFSDSSLGLGTGSSIFSLYNTQVNVSYTFDFFGSARRAIEALCAQVDYERYQLEATYLTLASNIVTTAITEASLRAQIKATLALIAYQTDLYKILYQQFELGAVAKTDVLTQESQLAQTRATLPPLEKSLANTRHALAVLIGTFPTEETLPQFCLEDLQLPTELPITLPSNLVRQRPDIRAAEALLHQANAQIGVATANLLPQITLNGYYGWEANALSTLFTPRSNVWSLTGQILQPIFQGGALLAQRRAVIHAYDQSAAQYRQTVLQAFQNVSDALRAIEFDAEKLKREVQSLETAEALLELSRGQFKLGAINYLTLLDAQRQYQIALINRIQAQAARYTDTAALFQALGGGWWGECAVDAG